VLCTLLANSLVVHTDETGWSINSVWAFLSEKARVLFYGVHKDADTLKEILDPATFAGLVISDDAAVYANFTQSQKCWAHLLRKAIKLTLQEPNNEEYREFTDRLLEIYNEAERTLRNPAQARQTGRTSKTAHGARRQTIIMTVLESLRLHLPTFTLAGIIGEVSRWRKTGHSCFTRLLNKMKLPRPSQSILDRVMPIPDG
jgi:hypothetical protein